MSCLDGSSGELATSQLTAWKPGMLSQQSSAKRPQPGFLRRESSGDLSHVSSATRILAQESSAKNPQPVIPSP